MHFFGVHREVHQGAFGELEDRFTRIAIMPVLVDGIRHRLATKWILYFQGRYGDAVDRKHHVQRLLATRAEMQLAGQPYTSWMEGNFWGPIGLRSVTSEPDSSGVQVGSSYTYMTARDWGRLGQFWLDAWHQRNDLLPQSWQREATQPSASNIEGNYGLGFWLNTQGSALPSLPKNLFYAGGHAGQRVMVIPDEELVIVRLGLSQSGVDLGVEEFVGQLLDVLDRETLQ